MKKWGIVGIGLMPWDSKMYNILKAQDHLYTLLSRGHTGSEARVVGSIVDFMFAPENHQAVIDKVCITSYMHVCAVFFIEQLFLHNDVSEPVVLHGSCACTPLYNIVLYLFLVGLMLMV